MITNTNSWNACATWTFRVCKTFLCRLVMTSIALYDTMNLSDKFLVMSKSLSRSTFVSKRHSFMTIVWNLFRRPVRAWSLQYTVLFLLIKEQKSTNAILFDDCFISQIIIKQFQSSSESSNIILLAIKTEQETF